MDLTAGQLLSMTRNTVIMSNMGASLQNVSFSDQALTNSIACPEAQYKSMSLSERLLLEIQNTRISPELVLNEA